MCIARKDYEQKAQIIETSNEMSREISKETKEYADNVLRKVEVVLEDALNFPTDDKEISTPSSPLNSINLSSSSAADALRNFLISS